MQNALTERLQITYPIIQAPMAGGVTTSELVAAVSNCGGLGMVGAGYLTPDQMRKQIKEIKKLTEKPFGVNLFVPRSIQPSETKIKSSLELLKPYFEKLNMREVAFPVMTTDLPMDYFVKQIKVLMEEQVSVCSFTFDLPTDEIISMLKKQGILLIGTATNVKEAVLNEKKGMDMVTVQGSEAGGHRGTFIGDSEECLIGLISLVPQVVDRIEIPVIAAGGIMDGRGLSASLCLGAKGVQMGTAFLTCKESGAPTIHKETILRASEDQTVLTRSFSGKWARAIKNQFISDMREYEHQFPEFPIQNQLTKTLRSEAIKQNNKDFISLWSGQSPALAKSQTVKELILHTIDETKAIMRL